MDFVDQYNAMAMKHLFPNWRQFGDNSVTPAHFANEHRSDIVILILTNKDLSRLKELDIVDIGLKADVMPNKRGVGKDLLFTITFYINEDNPSFQCVIPGDVPLIQKRYRDTLAIVPRITIFVATNEFEFIGHYVYMIDDEVRADLDKRLAELTPSLFH